MPIQHITPEEAHKILSENKEAVYLDVRSIPEFIQGHPAGSINIPILHYDQSSGQMVPNPDFAKVSENNLPKDKNLLVGCKAGGRSLQACQVLENLGYTHLSNVMGGFGGGSNPLTGDYQEGWVESGLPTSKDNGDGVGYESLKVK